MAKVDFSGGSSDFIDDALDSLDKCDIPYILLTFPNEDDVRADSRLTTCSVSWIAEMLSNGAMDEIIADQLGLDWDEDDDDEEACGDPA